MNITLLDEYNLDEYDVVGRESDFVERLGCTEHFAAQSLLHSASRMALLRKVR